MYLSLQRFMLQETRIFRVSLVVHTVTVITWEPEAGGSRIQDQPALYCKTLS